MGLVCLKRTGLHWYKVATALIGIRSLYSTNLYLYTITLNSLTSTAVKVSNQYKISVEAICLGR